MLVASALAGLTLAGRIQIWHVMALAAALGIINALDIPTRQAFVMDMVGREDLTNAIALNSSVFNAARMVGPAVAGVLVAALGEGWCFFANAVSYVAVIAGLLMMRIDRREPGLSGGTAVGRIVEGWRFVWHTRPIRALLILLGIVSLTGMPYAVLMPLFADQILHGGATALGILMGASGIGALAGAFVLASRRGLRGLGAWVAWSSAAFGLALVLFALSRLFWLSAAILVAAGFFSIVQMAASNTLIQSMAPDHLRGRVMSFYSMVFLGMAPLGALGAGTTASTLGAPFAVALGGIMCLASAALFGSRLRTLRPQARELILAQQVGGGEPVQGITGGPAA
jgi:MFS family permease